jgi:hypothetical protein
VALTLLPVGAGAADTRPRDDLITADDLSVVWPEVSHRLAKLLTSRGAARDVVDDVVQEVAARILAHGIVYVDAMDLMRWAVPVALNLLVDNARAAAKVTPVTEDHHSPVSDVADLVAHRDRLGRVLGAVRQLSPADRAALATPSEAPADRREAVKLAVRRHRARRRLLALVDGVAAFLGVVGGWLRRTRSSAATATVAIAAAPMALLLVAPYAPPAADPSPMTSGVSVQERRRVPSVRRPARAVPVRRPARPVPVVRVRPVSPRPAPAAPAAKREELARMGGGKAGAVAVLGHDASEEDGFVCVRDTGLTDDFCLLPRRVHHGL